MSINGRLYRRVTVKPDYWAPVTGMVRVAIQREDPDGDHHTREFRSVDERGYERVRKAVIASGYTIEPLEDEIGWDAWTFREMRNA